MYYKMKSENNFKRDKRTSTIGEQIRHMFHSCNLKAKTSQKQFIKQNLKFE